MLTQEEKEKILFALRSGEYKQTRCVLYNNHDKSYCAVGVIYKVLFDENPYVKAGSYIRVDEKIGHLLSYKIQTKNDVDDLNFNEIANFLEQTNFQG